MVQNYSPTLVIQDSKQITFPLLIKKNMLFLFIMIILGRKIISLDGQESKVKWKGTESSNPSSFIPQIQLTALQDQSLVVSNSPEMHTNSSEQKKMNIPVLERKISELKI